MSETGGRSARRRRQESYDIEIVNKEIPVLKDLHLETDLSGDVLVAAPEGQAGEKIGGAIAQALGGGAEVRSASEIRREVIGRRRILSPRVTYSPTGRSGAWR